LPHTFLLRELEHFRQEIDSYDFRLWQFLLQRERQISGPGR
jgi:hypothetical protein